jgi:hypothetical protein
LIHSSQTEAREQPNDLKKMHMQFTYKKKTHSKRLRDDVEGTVHDTVGIIVGVIKFGDDQDIMQGIIEYEV